MIEKIINKIIEKKIIADKPVSGFVCVKLCRMFEKLNLFY